MKKNERNDTFCNFEITKTNFVSLFTAPCFSLQNGLRYKNAKLEKLEREDGIGDEKLSISSNISNMRLAIKFSDLFLSEQQIQKSTNYNRFDAQLQHE